MPGDVELAEDLRDPLGARARRAFGIQGLHLEMESDVLEGCQLDFSRFRASEFSKTLTATTLFQ